MSGAAGRSIIIRRAPSPAERVGTKKAGSELSRCHVCGWSLSSGGWTLSSGGWTLSSGGWTLSSGGWTLSSGGWTLLFFQNTSRRNRQNTSFLPKTVFLLHGVVKKRQIIADFLDCGREPW